ncbi:MAG: tetratricopeptide repeat protein [Marinilabiliaceae bacterium]|nr:tetratricopeptide repeat protein [Marinilabiliaceae bacterium]
MQDYLQGNFEEINDALERFEFMTNTNREYYFDVHQIENLFDFYVEDNRFDLAEKVLKIGLKQHPQAQSLQVKSTILLSEMGLYDDALKILHNQVKMDANSTEINMSIGWLNLKKGHIEKAKEAFKITLLNANEEKESFFLDIGFSLNQEGFYTEAIEILKQANKEFIDNENLLFELAFAYDKAEEIDLGIETYQLLLDLNPFFDNAWYNLGILFNKKSKFSKAINAYEYSLALNPHHQESYFNMGNSYANLNQFELALENYLTHASYGIDSIIAYQYIGECWEQLNNSEYAIRFYNLVLQTNPESAEAWYGIGTTLLSTKLYKESLTPLSEAVKLNPNVSDFWFAYAKACYKTKQYKKAIASLEKGITIDPEEISAWIDLLQLHLKHSKKFDYISFIDNALNNYPTIGAVSYIAAVVYYKFASDKELALCYLKVGKKREPDDLNVIISEFPELLNSKEILKYIHNKVKNLK